MKYTFNKSKLLIILIMMLSGGNIVAGEFPEKGDMVKGAKSWSDNCMRCHNLRDASELRDDQWITTVFHMRVRSGLTGQEARDIITFLQNSN